MRTHALLWRVCVCVCVTVPVRTLAHADGGAETMQQRSHVTIWIGAQVGFRSPMGVVTGAGGVHGLVGNVVEPRVFGKHMDMHPVL
jgi:hypothetical protein